MLESISIAYFSMEIALESAIPTYSGGLGVLAGDTLRSAADAGIAMAGLTLLSRKGYFRQRLDENGWQQEQAAYWPVDNYLLPLNVQATIQIEDRDVKVRAWRYDIKGNKNQIVPIILLDTDIESNTEYDRTLTDSLYGGDDYYRLCQEVVLGIGGIRILRALACQQIQRYHMNEGHSSLLIFELLEELIQQEKTDSNSWQSYVDKIRTHCVFTTHTPVAAGHDRFPIAMSSQILKQYKAYSRFAENIYHNNELNLTYLALAASYYVNGVAKKHRETSMKMFEGYHIDSITNGIHVGSWTSEPFCRLFDEKISDWRQDNAMLRYAFTIDRSDIWQSHQQAKRALIEYTNKFCHTNMDIDIMTLGFARRATPYKRATLIFNDINRLQTIAAHSGALQIIFAGKAHPRDNKGREIIHSIFNFAKTLNSNIRIAYIPDYDISTGKLITAGVDLWLNTPLPPMEASGTSGMKAALNAVPSLSILDGWWIEGCIEGVTGWAISNSTPNKLESDQPGNDQHEAEILYSKLENIIMPMFYQQRDSYIDIMRNAIAINASFFNTERMISQYIAKAYFR